MVLGTIAAVPLMLGMGSMVAVATDPTFVISTFVDAVPYFKMIPATLSIIGCLFFVTRSIYVFKKLHTDMKFFRKLLLTAGIMIIISYVSVYPCQVCHEDYCFHPCIYAASLYLFFVLLTELFLIILWFTLVNFFLYQLTIEGYAWAICFQYFITRVVHTWGQISFCHQLFYNLFLPGYNLLCSGSAVRVIIDSEYMLVNVFNNHCLHFDTVVF